MEDEDEKVCSVGVEMEKEKEKGWMTGGRVERGRRW